MTFKQSYKCMTELSLFLIRGGWALNFPKFDFKKISIFILTCFSIFFFFFKCQVILLCLNITLKFQSSPFL